MSIECGGMITRRDEAGLPQPDKASLLASAGKARDTHAARETTAASASLPSFHTSPALGTKDAFHTKHLWVRAHAMADQSSQDRRARTGKDTQRVAYARAPFQVRRGGRTTTSMYCDTKVRKMLLARPPTITSGASYPSMLHALSMPMRTFYLRMFAMFVVFE